MTVVFAFVFMLLTVAAMAIGVIMGRKPIAGSCGGIRALGLGGQCEVCGGDPAACDSGAGTTDAASADAAELGSDAMSAGRGGGARRL